jgi:exosortase
MSEPKTEFLTRALPANTSGQSRPVRGEQNLGFFVGWLLVLLPFAWLWFRLLNNLSLEWTTNPQYSYGWLVPLLCAGLVYGRWNALRAANDPGLAPMSHRSDASRIVVAIFILLAFLYLPTRLIQGATPEWRPIQWALGFDTVGLTLCGIYLACGKVWLNRFLFPICFILIAIPWPTPIEAPIIQCLTRLNSSLAIESLSWLGIPAVQHGNLIEISRGTVGIDEACSGIRSFQTTLMVSLFFGEIYAMSNLSRVLLIPAGFVLTMALNACRLSLLTSIAAKKGTAAISQYHDPAGILITLACAIGLWGLVRLFNRRRRPLTSSPATTQGNNQKFTSPFLSGSTFPRFGYALLAWLVAVDAGSEIWYRGVESHSALSPKWAVKFPADNPSFKTVPISVETENLLRFDDGKQAAWSEPDGSRWQAFYFNWSPGRVAGYLAKRHTPEICLPAAGCKLVSGPKLTVTNVKGVELPIRSYVFDSENGPLYVFQSRWEAGARKNSYTESESSRFNLLRGIWAGRGDKGQKVIEIVVAGMNSPEQASTAFAHQLEELVVVED